MIGQSTPSSCFPTLQRNAAWDAVLKISASWRPFNASTGGPSPYVVLSQSNLTIDDSYAIHDIGPTSLTALNRIYRGTQPWTSGTRGWQAYDVDGSYGYGCAWHGVECSVYDASGVLYARTAGLTPYSTASGATFVTAITFASKGMKNSLPADISSFSELRRLYLSSNSALGGELPPAMSNSPVSLSLTTLDIGATKVLLTNVPILPQLTSLSADSMWAPASSTWDDSIGTSLPALRTLSMRSNFFTTFPAGFGNLSQLTSLDITGGRFASLGSGLCGCAALVTLTAQSNRFTSVAPCIPTALTSLVTLDMRFNTGNWSMPAGVVGNMAALTTANLDGTGLNDLDGALVNSYLLTTLTLKNNPLTGLSSAWNTGSARRGIISLDLSNCALTGATAIPDGVLTGLNFPLLRTIVLDSNSKLQGIGGIVNISALTSFSAAGCGMRTVPYMAQLPALTTITLSNNKISSLPYWIAELTALSTLSLDFNALTTIEEGDVSKNGTVQFYRSLSTLKLNNNQLTSLPAVLAGATLMSLLDAQYNDLQPGLFAPGFWNSRIWTFRTNYNYRFGVVPAGIRWMNQTRTWECTACGLTTVSTGICSMLAIDTLLWNNNSIAALPDCVVNMATLRVLQMASNQLTSLPSSLEPLNPTALLPYNVTRCNSTVVAVSALVPFNVTTNITSTQNVSTRVAVNSTGNATNGTINGNVTSTNSSNVTTFITVVVPTTVTMPVTQIVYANVTQNVTVQTCYNVTIIPTPPAVVIPLPNLNTLNLGNNMLPLHTLDLLTQLPNLQYLSLNNNWMMGVLPQTMLQYPRLVNLDVSYNLLTSLAPVTLTQAATISSDGLIAPIANQSAFSNWQIPNATLPFLPSWFGNMTHTLTWMNVAGNAMSGSLAAADLQFTGYGVSYPYTIIARGDSVDCAANPTALPCYNSKCFFSGCAAAMPASVWPLTIPTLFATTLTITGSGFNRNTVWLCEFFRIQDGTTGTSFQQSTAAWVSSSTITCPSPANVGLLGQITLRVRDNSVSPASGAQAGFPLWTRPLPTLQFIDGCPPGMSLNPLFGTSVGAAACLPCNEGYYQPYFNQTSCKACAPGTEAPNTGASSCDACPITYYASLPATKNCRPCLPGSFGNASSLAKCYPCAPGYYSPDPDTPLSACIPCPIGEYAPDAGRAQCLKCGDSSFTGFEGSTECVSCPLNTLVLTQGAKFVTDCVCAPGWYGPHGGPCKACPIGALCNGEGGRFPRALPGFWVDALADPESFYKCEPSEACLGAVLQPDGSYLNASCATGYTGRVCGACVPLRYYRLQEQCKKCPAYADLLWVALACAAFGGVFFLLWSSKPGDMKLYSPSIALTYVQMLALFHSFDVNWPNIVITTYNAASITNLNIELFSPECSVKLDFFSKWSFKMGVPLIAAGIFTVYYSALPLYRRVARSFKACYNRLRRIPRCRGCIKRCARSSEPCTRCMRVVGRVVRDTGLFFFSWTGFLLTAPFAGVSFAIRWSIKSFVNHFLIGVLWDRCLIHVWMRWRLANVRAHLHSRIRHAALVVASMDRREVPFAQRMYATRMGTKLDVAGMFLCNVPLPFDDSLLKKNSKRKLDIGHPKVNTPLTPSTSTSHDVGASVVANPLSLATDFDSPTGGLTTHSAQRRMNMMLEMVDARRSLRHINVVVGSIAGPPTVSVAAASGAERRGTVTFLRSIGTVGTKRLPRLGFKRKLNVDGSVEGGSNTITPTAVANPMLQARIATANMAAMDSSTISIEATSALMGGHVPGLTQAGSTATGATTGADKEPVVVKSLRQRNLAFAKSTRFAAAPSRVNSRGDTIALDVVAEGDTPLSSNRPSDMERQHSNSSASMILSGQASRAQASAGDHATVAVLLAREHVATAPSRPSTPAPGLSVVEPNSGAMPVRFGANFNHDGHRGSPAKIGLSLADTKQYLSFRSLNTENSVADDATGIDSSSTCGHVSFALNNADGADTADRIPGIPFPAAPALPTALPSPPSSSLSSQSKKGKFRMQHLRRESQRLHGISVRFAGLAAAGTPNDLMQLPFENTMVFEAPEGRRARTRSLNARRRAAGLLGRVMVTLKSEERAAGFGLLPQHVMARLRSAYDGTDRDGGAGRRKPRSSSEGSSRMNIGVSWRSPPPASKSATTTASGANRGLKNVMRAKSTMRLPASDFKSKRNVETLRKLAEVESVAAQQKAGGRPASLTMPPPGEGGKASYATVVIASPHGGKTELAAWKLNLLPRTAAEVALVKRFEIDENVTDRFAYAATNVLTIGYTFLASTALEPLNCVKQADGSYLLKSSADVSCYSDYYNQYLGLVVCAVLLYVIGVPCYLFYVLFKARAQGALHTPAFDYKHGSLTMPYNPTMWWFEMVNTMRKLGIVVVVQYLGRDGTAEGTLSQLMVAMSLFSIFAMIQVFESPYNWAGNGTLSLFTSLSLLYALFSGLLFFTERLTDASRFYVGITTVAIIAASGAAIVFTFLQEFKRARARAEICKALSMNRYQVTAMESRLLRRMFPHAGSMLVSTLGSMDENDRDAFIADCFQLLRLMPAHGLDPYQSLKSAQESATATSSSAAAGPGYAGSGGVATDGEGDEEGDDAFGLGAARMGLPFGSGLALAGAGINPSAMRSSPPASAVLDNGASPGSSIDATPNADPLGLAPRPPSSSAFNRRSLARPLASVTHSSSSSHSGSSSGSHARASSAPPSLDERGRKKSKRITMPMRVMPSLLWTGRQMEMVQLTENPLALMAAFGLVDANGKSKK